MRPLLTQFPEIQVNSRSIQHTAGWRDGPRPLDSRAPLSHKTRANRNGQDDKGTDAMSRAELQSTIDAAWEDRDNIGLNTGGRCATLSRKRSTS